jgi:hypothetical protein
MGKSYYCSIRHSYCRFIVLGFFKTIHVVTFLTADPAIPQCSTCITLKYNNTQRVIKSGVEMIVELPNADYDPEDLTIISNPNEIVEVYPAESHLKKTWARKLNFIAPGTVEIVVKSRRSTISDFRAIFTIQ